MGRIMQVTCPKCSAKLKAVYISAGKNPIRIPFLYCETCKKFYSMNVVEA